MREQTFTQPTDEEIRDLEERLLNPVVRASFQELDGLLADDFMEFGSSGHICNKQQVIEALLRQPDQHWAIRDFRMQPLAPGVVLVTYRAIRYANQPGKATHSLRSSIWRCEEGRWRMIFHQGTPMEAI